MLAARHIFLAGVRFPRHCYELLGKLNPSHVQFPRLELFYGILRFGATNSHKTHTDTKNRIVVFVIQCSILSIIIMSMYVVKRGGRRESVHFDKITSRVSKLCYGLDPKVCFVLRKLLDAIMAMLVCCGCLWMELYTTPSLYSLHVLLNSGSVKNVLSLSFNHRRRTLDCNLSAAFFFSNEKISHSPPLTHYYYYSM